MPHRVREDLHKGALRAGPIRLGYTRKAFHRIPALHKPRVLDVGCGEGGPTLELARLSDGQIIGLDLNRASLDRLVRSARAAGLSSRVLAVQGSLNHIGFADGCFDVIWSEGTVHIIGFEQGLRAWRSYIRPGGVLVLHGGIRPRPTPPPELEAHWQGRYREVRTISEYLAAIPATGYRLVDHFTVPEDVWWIEYFQPLDARIRALRETYAGDREALAVLEREAREVEMFQAYPAWYGSAFFVMQTSLR